MSNFRITKSTNIVPTGIFSDPAPVVSLYLVEKGCRRQEIHCGTYSVRDAAKRQREIPLSIKSNSAMETIRPRWGDAR